MKMNLIGNIYEDRKYRMLNGAGVFVLFHPDPLTPTAATNSQGQWTGGHHGRLMTADEEQNSAGRYTMDTDTTPVAH